MSIEEKRKNVRPEPVEGQAIVTVNPAGLVLTTSLVIAEKFNKKHCDVLRSIRSLECSVEFTERNFALSSYTDSTGRNLPMYNITRDGFSFLAMGFTGKEAAQWKEKFITAFNQMEARLAAPVSVETSPTLELITITKDHYIALLEEQVRFYKTNQIAKNVRAPFTAAEDAIIQSERAKGSHHVDIAKLLGRSKGSVDSRVTVLNRKLK